MVLQVQKFFVIITPPCIRKNQEVLIKILFYYNTHTYLCSSLQLITQYNTQKHREYEKKKSLKMRTTVPSALKLYLRTVFN